MESFARPIGETTPPPGGGEVGAPRVRGVATTNLRCADGSRREIEGYHPSAILDFGVWPLAPR